MLKLKKMFSAFVGTVMAVNMFMTMPFSAFADEETTSRMYIYDDYEISYDITNSWGNTEAISVTLTNTGDESIENWMLVYDDFNGEISGIWDAKVAETDSGYEYVRNVGYNANISPNQSISFGYTLDNYMGVPDVITMSQKRLEKATSAYSAELNVVSEWGDMFQGEITLTNNTDEPIEWWELTFDSNFTITKVTTSWAASVVDNGDCNYTFKGTYTGIVDANSSVVLGFQAIEDGDPEITNVSLTDVVYAGDEASNEYNLEDIGEAYYKDIESLDDIDVDNSGIKFVKNQFLLTAYNDVPYTEIKALGEEYNAEIVGYIELTNSYQFEVTYNVDSNGIHEILNELEDNTLVEFSSLNTISMSGDDAIPDDPWNKEETINWDTENPSGSNWGVEAIDTPGAWDYIDQMCTVKIGIYDSAFNTNHEDLNYFNVWHNESSRDTNVHGTHVSGTIAAIYDNGTGISGVTPYNQLYAVSRTGLKNESNETYGTAMEHQYAYAVLIGNRVKVINVSQNDCNLRDDSEETFDENTSILGNFLHKLIDMKYDFVIVTSAGNKSSDDAPVDARTNSFLNHIEDEIVKSKIIVVASVGLDKSKQENSIYSRATTSCEGERVDIAAPGEQIYSTWANREGYHLLSGTSMAAPHVSGVAGLLYSVNPNLSAEQVKEIIVETSGGEGKEFTDCLGGSYGLVNAKLAVEKALEIDGENVSTNKTTVYVRDFVSDEELVAATIHIQGIEAENSGVDMYLTEGIETDITTGWYNIAVSLNGYVTYRYSFYNNSSSVSIYLVEESEESGYLQITAKDWITNDVADTEFNLYTIDENFNQVQVNTDGTYPTTSGVTEMIMLSPGYYLPTTTTGTSQYTQELYSVAANHTTEKSCNKFGFSGDVETYGFEVSVEGGSNLDINFQLAARSSEDSLKLNESMIAKNIHPVNFSGVYFHFYDSEEVRNNKVFSIGFELTQAEIEKLSELSEGSLTVNVMVSHGGYGTPSFNSIWIDATDIVGNWDAKTEFAKFATISYDFDNGEYEVNSDYWILDP